MRFRALLVIVLLIVSGLPAMSVQDGTVVTVCDEANLLAALAGGGTVTFACSGTLTLSNTNTVTDASVLDGSGQNVTLGSNNVIRVQVVPSGVHLTLKKIAIANGTAATSNISSGGVSNNGTLIVDSSKFTNNKALSSIGSAIYNGSGTVSISNSTFSQNSSKLGTAIFTLSGTLNVSVSAFLSNAPSNEGSAIRSDETSVTIANSTFINNIASALGGCGIYTECMAHISKSTLAFNNAATQGCAITDYETSFITNRNLFNNSTQSGGGIYGGSENTLLKNSIVAISTSGSNCSGKVWDGIGNLSYPDNTCPGINGNPMLAALQFNGRRTQTMLLLMDSAAIDWVWEIACGELPVNYLDQRGFKPPESPECVIGVVETTVYPQGTPAAIDVRPGDVPNTIQCRAGNQVITVAILTTQVFDALSVDHTTVKFESAGETHRDRKSGAALRQEEDVDCDGDLELVFYFRLDETYLTCYSRCVLLNGFSYAGQQFSGADLVQMIGGG